MMTSHLRVQRSMEAPDEDVAFQPPDVGKLSEFSNASEHAIGIEVMVPSVKGCRLPPRGGHTAVLNDHELVVFGGQFLESQGKFMYLNETHVLDLETMTWTEKHCYGSIPQPRYGHCSHLIDTRMFVFGGRSASGESLKDVHVLDVTTGLWSEITPVTEEPPGRFYHASAVVGKQIIVHGGWDGKDTVFGDLWVFDTEAFSWTPLSVHGLEPLPRYGHSLTLCFDGNLYLFGGVRLCPNLLVQYYNDIAALNLSTMTWSRAATGGMTPSRRFGHTQCLTPCGSILYNGGWGRYGMQNDVYQEGAVTTFDFNPETFMFQHVSSTVGGESQSTPSTKSPGSSRELTHRYGHTSTLVGDFMVVFGGWNGQQALSLVEVVEFK